jgi:ketosteroid isomerase-like protein
MSAELIAFVEALDRCWIERRFDDLAGFLAPDVVMVAPGGTMRREGIDKAIESYREFMARAEVSRFQARDFVLTERGITAIVEYRWDMAWRKGGVDHQASGREVLVLSRLGSGWCVVWRTQLSGGREGEIA